MAEHGHPVRQLARARRQHAAVACGAHVLQRIEAESAGGAQRADHAPAYGRAHRLGRVLDHVQAAGLGHGGDGVHVGGIPGEVHGDHGTGARSDRVLEGGGVHQVLGVDVHEDGHGTGHDDGPGRCHEAVGGGDHLIARPDAQGLEGEEDRVRARVEPQREGRAAQGGEAGLELCDLRPEDELAALELLGDPGEHRPVLELAGEVHVPDANGRHLSLDRSGALTRPCRRPGRRSDADERGA